jgi:hypothetical protein
MFAGCGRVAFDPIVDPGPGSDGGPVIDARPVADAGPPRCAANPDYTVRGTQANRYRELVDQAWQEAVDACLADDAHLAVPDNAAEAAAIALPVTAVWIGVDDRAEEGAWMTALGSPATYLPWGMLQPSGGTSENCVELPSDLTFNDLSCVDHRRSAICECELP